MRTLATLLAAAAIAAFGFAGAAQADPFADVVENFAVGTGTTGGNPDTNATGADNGGFVSLGDGGVLILRFTDNVCLDDGAGTPDLEVFEIGLAEEYDVDVGLIGGGLTGLGTFDGSVTINTAGAVASFNRLRLTDDNVVEGGVNTAGADIDAVECLNNFDFGIDHIVKTNVGSGDITIQAKGATSNGLQVFEFDITIDNPNGEDLTDIVFKDVLPAEFDLDPVAEDAADGGGIDDCVSGDGVCDGVAVTSETDANDCTATGAEHTNQGKSNKPFKLQPDIITMTAVGVDDDDTCVITVFAITDTKSDKPNKVANTPTECNEGSFIFLNEGVEVIDTMGTTDPSDDVTLFIDDDQIELTCVAATF